MDASTSSSSSASSKNGGANENVSSTSTQLRLQVPSIIDGEGNFFELLENKSSASQVVAVCMRCLPGHVEIKGHSRSSSNFVSHLKRKHGQEAIDEYTAYLQGLKNAASKRRKLESGLSSPSFQEQFIDYILQYVIHTMVPLSTVDSLQFREIFNHINSAMKPSHQVEVPSRRTICRRMDKSFQNNVDMLQKKFASVEYVCTTADIWSGALRSFLGVTAHWIDETTLKRHSAALACTRFTDSHTHDRIADLLHQIHLKYNLYTSKIRATTTDNGSNFVKAFKEFAVQETSVEIENVVTDEDDCVDSESEMVDNVEKKEDEDEEANDLIVQGLPDEIFCLPQHIRCCSHTLNLCATTDIAKIIKKSPELNSVHEKVMSKCNLLWRASSRPKSSEIIKKILGFALSRPCVSRWNSLYKAWKKITQSKVKCAEVFLALKLKDPISDDEFLYIEEHLACAEPVAVALDLLQGEEHVYFGSSVAVLYSLILKLEKLSKKDFKFCKSIAQGFLNSVNIRFEPYFKFNCSQALDAGVAALAHPEFKARWMHRVPQDIQTKLKNLFVEAVVAEFASDSTSTSTTDSDTKENSFFDFGEETDSSLCRTLSMDAQALQYLADPRRTLESLNSYPQVKRVFIKFNTPLPSSGPVERLFSIATWTDEPKCNKLSDNRFELRVILRANSHLVITH